MTKTQATLDHLLALFQPVAADALVTHVSKDSWGRPLVLPRTDVSAILVASSAFAGYVEESGLDHFSFGGAYGGGLLAEVFAYLRLVAATSVTTLGTAYVSTPLAGFVDDVMRAANVFRYPRLEHRPFTILTKPGMFDSIADVVARALADARTPAWHAFYEERLWGLSNCGQLLELDLITDSEFFVFNEPAQLGARVQHANGMLTLVAYSGAAARGVL